MAAEVATQAGVICAGVGACVRWECTHPHLCSILFYKMLYTVEKGWKVVRLYPSVRLACAQLSGYNIKKYNQLKKTNNKVR